MNNLGSTNTTTESNIILTDDLVIEIGVLNMEKLTRNIKLEIQEEGDPVELKFSVGGAK